MVNVALVGVMEGLALGLAHGLDRDLLVALFQAALGSESGKLDQIAADGGSGDREATDSTILTWAGGIQAVARAADDAGVQTRLAKAALETFQDAEGAGYGMSSMSAIVAERLASRRSATS